MPPPVSAVGESSHQSNQESRSALARRAVKVAAKGLTIATKEQP